MKQSLTIPLVTLKENEHVGIRRDEGSIVNFF